MPRDIACKTRGQDGFAALLSRRALSSPTTCRFIPALSGLPTILLEAAGSIQGIAVLASKATVLFLKGQLPHGHRLPGGSPVLPLVVRDLFDMGSVVPHHEQFAVGLRRIRVNPFILETHSGTGECDRLSIR